MPLGKTTAPATPIRATDRVAQFSNQQLGGLISGTGSQVGQRDTPVERNPLTQERVAPEVSVGTSEVAKLTKQPSVRMKETNKKLLDYAKQSRRSRTGGSSGVGGASESFTSGSDLGKIGGTRGQVVQEAASYLGDPYVFAGNTHKGIDCSGLVQQVYKKFGFNLPRLAAQQGATMPGVRTSVNNLKPGDIVVWRDGSHIAIYAGNGEIIQAANPSQGVIRSRLTNQVGFTPDSVFGVAIRFPGE